MSPTTHTATPIPEEARRTFQAAAERLRTGDNAGAMKHFIQAIELHPGYFNAYNNIAVLLSQAKKQAAAIACVKRAIHFSPPSATLHSNLGNFLRQAFRFEEAAAAFRRAIELEPGRPETLHNLGLLLHAIGDYDTAIDCYTRALERMPQNVEMRWNRALSLLAKGDLAQGFAEYELRWGMKGNAEQPPPLPRWNGEDIRGRTLCVHSEQGIGDTLQFVRYLPMLAERGARVIFRCPIELVRVLVNFPGVAELTANNVPMPAADFHVPLLSLPRLLGTTLESIPAPIPYIAPRPGVTAPPVARPAGTKITLGIVWAGKPTHESDESRSTTLEQLLPLADIPGVAIYSLQKGARAADIATLGAEALVRDLGSRLNDFAETAALLREIDLVVSVDTAVAHLAGAMGRPAFVMLPYIPDWRWMNRRHDTPWYPSLHLIRQTSPGDWKGVMRRVCAAVEAFAATAASG